MQRKIPNTLEIKMFMHCKQCLEEKPASESPRDYARLEIGWTDLGCQVWCRRHEINVAHIDFQGQKHPANSSAAPPAEGRPNLNLRTMSFVTPAAAVQVAEGHLGWFQSMLGLPQDQTKPREIMRYIAIWTSIKEKGGDVSKLTGEELDELRDAYMSGEFPELAETKQEVH